MGLLPYLPPYVKHLQWCWGHSVNTSDFSLWLKCCQTLRRPGSELQRHLGWFKAESGACLWVLGLNTILVGWRAWGHLRLTVPTGAPWWRSPNCPACKDQCSTLHLHLPQRNVHGECCPATYWLSSWDVPWGLTWNLGFKGAPWTASAAQCRHSWTKLIGKSGVGWETYENLKCTKYQTQKGKEHEVSQADLSRFQRHIHISLVVDGWILHPQTGCTDTC